MLSKGTRREFMQAVGLGAAAAAAGSNAAGAPDLQNVSTNGLEIRGRKPNVVLVMTDDQGYGDLGCHGNRKIITPNLDKLHGQSTRLTNFHVAPTCAPTRSGVMSGHYCDRNGAWHTIMGRSFLRRDEVTMADVFKGSGYRTGIFGKWHLGDNYPYRPQDRGFDEVLVNGGGGVTQAPDCWNNDYFSDHYYHNGKQEKYEGYCTDVWFRNAMDFIEKNKDRPFFTYLVTNAPHGPFFVPQKYLDLYENMDGIPNKAFYAMITNIDENMAKLAKHLDDLGIADNTILIFMTDNGTAAGVKLDNQGYVSEGYGAGMRGQKGSAYEGGHRVPCFWRWPAGGIQAGKDVARLTANVDLMPTLIDLCGLAEPNVTFDGTSIRDLLYGDGTNWPERVMVTDSQRILHPVKWRVSSTMTDRWRLIDGEELYDVLADPEQRNDVATQHPEVVQRLRDAYDEWWESVSERFDEYSEIVIGSDFENPQRLSSHDWLNADGAPWNQQQIRQGQELNGPWAIEVERDGTYEFKLCRWPKEANAGMCETVPEGDIIPSGPAYPPGKALNIKTARLKIQDVDVWQPVNPTDKDATFTVELHKGSTMLQTWLDGDDGSSRGAYYVYVKRL